MTEISKVEIQIAEDKNKIVLQNKAKELLQNKAVDIIIGYGEGTDNTVHAVFITNPDNTSELIYDERCLQNLAVYLLKAEVRKFTKIGIIANIAVMRTILQLASENQLKEEKIVIIGITADGSLKEFSGFNELQEYIQLNNLDISKEDQEILNRLDSMTAEERWNYWTEQFSRCNKCYACRAACPLCYCNRCQVEYNQPQIITPESTTQGNFEWHFMRAMHLAGRCIECGECGRACSVNIPVHLLTFKMSQTVKNTFGITAGTDAKLGSVMSTFKPDDKENFIQ